MQTTTSICSSQDERTEKKGHTSIYENRDGNFQLLPFDLPHLDLPTGDWVDVDLNGSLDLVLSGVLNTRQGFAGLFSFESTEAQQRIMTLPPFEFGDFAWADLDNDGDQDLLLMGRLFSSDQAVPHTEVYRNDAGAFTAVGAGMLATSHGQARWIDVNSDHLLDALVIGRDAQNLPVTSLYIQTDTFVFEATNSNLPAYAEPIVAWSQEGFGGEPALFIAGNTKGVLESRLYTIEP